MGFSYDIEVKPNEAHAEMLSQIETDEDTTEDEQLAARAAMNAALRFMDYVGQPAIDPGVKIHLEGEPGETLSVTVEAVPAEPADEPINVPAEELAEPEDEEEIPPLAIAGQHQNPQTGDPIVDNFPGHPEAAWIESVPEESVIHEPPEEVDVEPAPPVEPKPSIENPTATGEPPVTKPQEVDREAQDNQMAGLEPSDTEDVENRPEPDEGVTLSKPGDDITVEPGDDITVTKPGEAPAPDFRGMTIEQVLEAVGDDRQLAEDALASEEASARPRPTLITQLEDIIDEGGA